MREIEFRGKSTNTNKWEFGLLGKTKYGNLVINNTRQHFVDEYTIGQYVGLKDKNGTKIFEGDIIKDILGDIAVIVYKEKYSAFVADKWETGYGLWFGKDIEVIGNIYDKTELIKGDEN